MEPPTEIIVQIFIWGLVAFAPITNDKPGDGFKALMSDNRDAGGEEHSPELIQCAKGECGTPRSLEGKRVIFEWLPAEDQALPHLGFVPYKPKDSDAPARERPCPTKPSQAMDYRWAINFAEVASSETTLKPGCSAVPPIECDEVTAQILLKQGTLSTCRIANCLLDSEPKIVKIHFGSFRKKARRAIAEVMTLEMGTDKEGKVKDTLVKGLAVVLEDFQTGERERHQLSGYPCDDKICIDLVLRNVPKESKKPKDRLCSDDDLLSGNHFSHFYDLLRDRGPFRSTAHGGELCANNYQPSCSEKLDELLTRSFQTSPGKTNYIAPDRAICPLGIGN